MGLIISYFNPIDYKKIENIITPIIKEIVIVEIEKLKIELKDKDPTELNTEDTIKEIAIVVLDKIEEVLDECGNTCCK